MTKAVIFCLCVLALFCASPLVQAQSVPLPNATVGVPYIYQTFGGFDFSQYQQYFVGTGITFTITITGQGNIPPGIAVDGNGNIAGTPTAVGTYDFSINLQYSIVYMGVDYCNSLCSYAFPVSLVVAGGTGPAITVEPSGMIFPAAQGTATTQSQSIVVSNRGGTAQTVTATSSTNNGSGWLNVSGGGSVAPYSSTTVTVIVTPGSLPAGTYTGDVTIKTAPAGQTNTVSIVATVSGAQKQITLSQTGLRFQTVSGGGTPPSQAISVYNSGSGSFNFDVTATTSSGAKWLTVSPTSGTAAAGSLTNISVNINPAGLGGNDYYGMVQISAPGVDNSPQVASVVLNVAASGTNLGAFVDPTGLILVGAAGGAAPAAKTITITNPSPTPLTFGSTLYSASGNTSWLTVTPSNGMVTSSAPTQVKIQPVLTGLTPNVYTAELTLYFSPGNTMKHVQIILIVVPAGTVTSTDSTAQGIPALATGCTPTKLVPVFTQLGSGFGTVASWPTPIELTVVDDCGTPMTTGSVVTSFSSGDAALGLKSLLDGRWSATWQPRSTATQVTITAKAQQPAPALAGTQSIGGSLTANPTTPAISSGGAVSAASNVLNQPLAPGSFTSIYGAHLSSGLNQSTTAPFATQLGATQVLLGGRALPLQFAVDGQVNAIVPYDVPPNTTQQLLVMNGPAISVPEPVIIAAAQPAIFTQDSSGKGLGSIVGVKPDGSFAVVDASHPVSAGDTALIYCAGLGPVNPPVAAGDAAPATSLSRTVNDVTVTIGGQDAPVAFAGLSPGFVGLYQINATVPSGITPGNDVPVVVMVAGQKSTPVTIVVK